MVVICLYAWINHYPSNPPDFANVGWFVYRIALLPIELVHTLLSPRPLFKQYCI
jgi:hypothetical protein